VLTVLYLSLIIVVQTPFLLLFLPPVTSGVSGQKPKATRMIFFANPVAGIAGIAHIKMSSAKPNGHNQGMTVVYDPGTKGHETKRNGTK
jgi:hypothetical protein